MTKPATTTTRKQGSALVGYSDVPLAMRHAHEIRGRILDLPAHHLDALAGVMAKTARWPRELRRAQLHLTMSANRQRQKLARAAAAQHFRLTAGDLGRPA
jgi:hypothetical protein